MHIGRSLEKIFFSSIKKGEEEVAKRLQAGWRPGTAPADPGNRDVIKSKQPFGADKSCVHQDLSAFPISIFYFPHHPINFVFAKLPTFFFLRGTLHSSRLITGFRKSQFYESISAV